MGIVVFTFMTFTCGFICASISDWRIYTTFAALSGLLTGMTGRAMGVL